METETTSSWRGVLLGLDHGEKYIGVAIGDASWIIARPLAIIERATRDLDFDLINRLIAKHSAVALIVGHPQTPEDFDGVSQARTVERWASRLAAAVSVPVYLWDEALSTFDAERLSQDAGLAPVARIDDRAAAVMLQSFIDAHPTGTPLPNKIR